MVQKSTSSSNAFLAIFPLLPASSSYSANSIPKNLFASVTHRPEVAKPMAIIKMLATT
jgi:hypothetical protein